jgi:tellurite resistance protein TerC
MTFQRALRWSAFWFLLACAFGAGVTAVHGGNTGIEFFTGYLVEQALSIDNLFVMMLVFSRLRIPKESQHRVLMWGIAGVIVLRGVMIAGGTALIGTFHALTYVLGGLLLFAAYKLARELGTAEDKPATTPGASRVRALVGRVFPLTDELHGSRFTVVINGIRHATPLLVALVTIELADAVFALDSIPAVLGVTTDPFVVVSSNLFAVLGLRSLYFALSGLLDQLRYLKHGLVGVLAIIGTKMVLAMVWTTPAWLSLVLVTLTLGVAIVASLAHSPRTNRIPDAAR